MIAFADGVSIRRITPELVLAMFAVSGALELNGAMLIITHVVDGEHGDPSFHYTGRAFDFRTRELDDETLGAIVSDVMAAGVPNLQLVIEDRGGPNEHGHVEIDHPLERPVGKHSSDRITA